MSTRDASVSSELSSHRFAKRIHRRIWHASNNACRFIWVLKRRIIRTPRSDPNSCIFPDCRRALISPARCSRGMRSSKNTDVIRGELLALLGDKKNFEPFLDIPSPEQVPHYLGGEKPTWNAFFFYRHGYRYDENCARCPRTTEILDGLPLARIAEHAPEVCFSVLTPGTHILPHHGSTNTRLVTHLPLVVPPDCAINVGGELHVWEEGRCITFDDTFEHEAWNRSDETRTVLILDVWNPHLTDLEKRAVTALIEAIRSFNRMAGVIAE